MLSCGGRGWHDAQSPGRLDSAFQSQLLPSGGSDPGDPQVKGNLQPDVKTPSGGGGPRVVFHMGTGVIWCHENRIVISEEGGEDAGAGGESSFPIGVSVWPPLGCSNQAVQPGEASIKVCSSTH